MRARALARRPAPEIRASAPPLSPAGLVFLRGRDADGRLRELAAARLAARPLLGALAVALLDGRVLRGPRLPLARRLRARAARGRRQERPRVGARLAAPRRAPGSPPGGALRGDRLERGEPRGRPGDAGDGGGLPGDCPRPHAAGRGGDRGRGPRGRGERGDRRCALASRRRGAGRVGARPRAASLHASRGAPLARRPRARQAGGGRAAPGLEVRGERGRGGRQRDRCSAARRSGRGGGRGGDRSGASLPRRIPEPVAFHTGPA